MTGVAILTLRECHRRSFPYVALLAISGLLLASHSFQAFSFGAAARESANLAISGVFLAGLLHAAFLGTELVRRDLERGTLSVVLTKPVGLAAYLAGRMAGLAGAAAALCLAVTAAVAAIFLLPIGPATEEAPFGPELWAGCARAVLPVLVLEAAALAASVFAGRVYAPLLLLALFAAGNLASGPVGWLLPDFGIFGLEAGAAPAVGLLMLYTGVQIAAFLLIAYVGLASRAVFQSRS